MKGVVQCLACGHHQPWTSRSTWEPGKIAGSKCLRCLKRNRFYPGRFNQQEPGVLRETRGRKPAVLFRRRPDWTINLQMASESRARNRGSIVDEEELMFQETQDFKDRVQNRIDELQKVKDALN